MRGHVIWDPVWNFEYISPWCVFEWFKRSNFVANKDIIETYGNNEAKSNQLRRSSRELWNFNWMMNKALLFESVFGQSLFLPVERFVNRFVRPINSGDNIPPPNNKSNPKYYFVRQRFTYCPECLKIGFHSLFHQYVLLDTCPYHGLTLKQQCPQCHSSTLYELHRNTASSGAFSCRCGYLYTQSTDKNYYWNEIHNLRLTNNEIIDWLKIETKTLESMSELCLISRDLFRDEPLPKGEHILKEIVGFLKDIETPRKVIEIRTRVGSESLGLPKESRWYTNIINEFDSLIQQGAFYAPNFVIKGKTTTIEQYIKQNINFDTYVCLTFFQIYKSILRRIRRKYLNKETKKMYGPEGKKKNYYTSESLAYIRLRQEYEGELHGSHIEVVGSFRTYKHGIINLRRIPKGFTTYSFDGAMTTFQILLKNEYKDQFTKSTEWDRDLWAGVVRVCSRMIAEQVLLRYKTWTSFLASRDMKKEDDRFWNKSGNIPAWSDFPIFYIKLQKEAKSVLVHYNIHPVKAVSPLLSESVRK